MASNVELSNVKQLVESSIPGAGVEVTTDGYYVTVHVVSELFAGKRPVARQQMVYKGLSELIASGELHAVNILAKTPDEA